MSKSVNTYNLAIIIFLTTAALLAGISSIWVLPKAAYYVIGPLLVLSFVSGSVMLTEKLLKTENTKIDEVYDYHSMYNLTR